MSDLQKGYIRWWKHRVMDYEGDNEGKWERPPYPNVNGVEVHWQSDEALQWQKLCKFIQDPYEDKPYATIFHATMKLQGFYRGRSAAGFTFIDESGREHTMRIKCVVDLLKNAVLNKGVVKADWCYCKQGSNFSLKLVMEK